MKELTEMTFTELWQLFPIILKEYDPAYPSWYAEVKCRLEQIFSSESLCRISHIGSTSVPGLLAKPTIDILAELSSISDISRWKAQLTEQGWICMSQEKTPEYKLVFNKGYTKTGFAKKVFHLHVRMYGDWDELYFRDYLREYTDRAEEYAALKRKLKEKYEYNRNAYTEGKTEFIKRSTKEARKLYGNRYGKGGNICRY